MPRFIIHHVTRYMYAGPVVDSANQIMLFPVNDGYQQLLRQEWIITGQPRVETYRDYYGNDVGIFTLAPPHQELSIDVRHTVLTQPREYAEPLSSIQEQWQELTHLREQPHIIDFLHMESMPAQSDAFHWIHDLPHQVSVWDAVQQLNQFVYQHFQYIKGVTSVESTLEEIWRLQAGVCQDFAHVLLALLRQIGIPARYVSGYVCPHDHQLRGEGATHAWVEAWIPSLGWVGVDPTNNCLAQELHVKLAVGRDFSDCSPVKGTYKGTAEHRLEVGVSVVHEDGWVAEEVATILTAQPIPPSNQQAIKNSYLEHMQAMQQQ